MFGTHAKYLGGLVHNLPLTARNRFLPDFASVPADVLKRAKVLVLNYPNNPTGASATPEFFASAVEFAREEPAGGACMTRPTPRSCSKESRSAFWQPQEPRKWASNCIPPARAST